MAPLEWAEAAQAEYLAAEFPAVDRVKTALRQVGHRFVQVTGSSAADGAARVHGAQP